MSLPLLTYLQMYLIDLTELQISTFMWALYVLDSKGEYGTTHLLSTSKNPLRICKEAVLPPSSADLRLNKGYPSVPVTVLETNARGYRLEHLPSIMQGELGFRVLQGP